MAPLSRRELLAGAAAAAFGAGLGRARGRESRPGPREEVPLLERTLDRTGRILPCLGLGCFPLGELSSEEEAVALLARAFESGARYFDTAPSYGGGRSERRVGKGLARFPRERLFVATKTLEREGDAALAELEESLERLGMDYVDSVQVHEVGSEEDVKSLFRKAGVVAALESARDKKRLRHIGVTGHRDPQFLLQAIERYPFDTALVPVNPLDCHHRSFTRDFVPKAREKEVAVIAMKVYAGGALPRQRGEVPAADLVRFALAQGGVCVAVPGADSASRWDEARAAAVSPPPDAAEQERLIARCGPHRGKASEWYKNA